MKLYLAHAFDSRKTIQEWERYFEERSNIELVNPFYDVPDRAVPVIDNGITREERTRQVASKFRQIVDVDLREVSNSNGVIAFIDGSKQIGTIMEMVYANLFRKPVYSVVTNGMEQHPWILYHSTKIFTKLGDLEEFLMDLSEE